MLTILGLLGGFLLKIPGLASGVIQVLNKRADADLQKHLAAVEGDKVVNTAVLQAWVQAQVAAAAARNADRGSWLTAWMMPAAFLIAVSHFGAVVFDSMPIAGHVVGSWGIAALPGDYAELQRAIIYSAAGIVSVKSVAGAVGKIFTR